MVLTGLGILKALLSLAGSLTSYLSDRRLISAGEKAAMMRGITNAKNQVDKARRARANTKLDEKSVRNDRANRDR